jgi:mRNA-degrading endonuclease RelE of RelBE toxin-antitoxin system
MKYTVDWLPAAEQELTELWLSAADRDAITRASHRMDQRLRADPQNEGESRADGRRILFDAPLGIIYRVLANEHRVVVSHVWKFRTSN